MQITQSSLPFEYPDGNSQPANIPPVLAGYSLYYEQEKGKLYLGNCLDWLGALEDQSVDLIFADPPYNINKADWDNFNSQEEYINWSMQWIEQASRVLKKSGSLYVCGFSEILAAKSFRREAKRCYRLSDYL